MERIRLSGYTPFEKKHIATQYLIPKQLQSNGLNPSQFRISEEALLKLIRSYTRESGVRNLEREIGSVCRAKAVEFADAKDNGKLDSYNSIVQLADLEHILGSERYEAELAAAHLRPGIVTGLVAFSISGNGSILFIEAADMPGNGRLQLTGKLGDVIKGSYSFSPSSSHVYLHVYWLRRGDWLQMFPTFLLPASRFHPSATAALYFTYDVVLCFPLLWF